MTTQAFCYLAMCCCGPGSISQGEGTKGDREGSLLGYAAIIWNPCPLTIALQSRVGPKGNFCWREKSAGKWTKSSHKVIKYSGIQYSSMVCSAICHYTYTHSAATAAIAQGSLCDLKYYNTHTYSQILQTTTIYTFSLQKIYNSHSQIFSVQFKTSKFYFPKSYASILSAFSEHC